MIPSKTILVAAAALFAAVTFIGAGEANAHGGFGGGSPYCHWYKQQAMNTGDDYWWGRWRRCIRGDYWD